MGQERGAQVVIDKFGGINLATAASNLAPGMSPAGINVWGDGTFVQKRPGRQAIYSPSWMSATTRAYDMVRARLVGGGSTGYDALLILYRPAGSTQQAVGAINLFTGAAVVVSSGLEIDTRGDGMITVCDTLAILSAGPSSTAYRQINWSGAAYQVAALTGPALKQYAQTEWHKRHAAYCGYHPVMPSAGTSYCRTDLSEIDDPTTYPANNNFPVDPKGLESTLRGLRSSGEALYYFKSDSAWVLTGNAMESFELNRIPGSIGVNSKRSSICVNGVVYAIASIPRKGTIDYDPEPADPFSIAAIAGREFKDIGLPVRKIVNRVFAGGTDDSRCGWIKRNSNVLFLPYTREIASGFGPPPSYDAVVLNTDSGTWWQWTFESDATTGKQIKALVPVGQDLYYLDYDGGVGLLDELSSVDAWGGSTPGVFPTNKPFVSSWRSGAISLDTTGGAVAPQFAKMFGSQLSGGKAKLWIYNGDGNRYLAGLFDLTAAGAQVPLAGKSPASKVNYFEVEFDQYGRRSRMDKMIVSEKPVSDK